MPQDIETEGITWTPFTINNTLHKTKVFVFQNFAEGAQFYYPQFDTHAYLLKGNDYFGGNDSAVLSRSINYYTSNLVSEIMKKW